MGDAQTGIGSGAPTSRTAANVSDDSAMNAATAPGSDKIYLFEIYVSEVSALSAGRIPPPQRSSPTPRARTTPTPTPCRSATSPSRATVPRSWSAAPDGPRATGSVPCRLHPPLRGWANTDTPDQEWLGAGPQPSVRLAGRLRPVQRRHLHLRLQPAYGITTAEHPDTADVNEEERGITETEYTIYHIDRSN